MSDQSIGHYLSSLGREYKKDRVSLYAASIAYFAIFALSPLIIVATIFWSFWLGRERTVSLSSGALEQQFGQIGVIFYNNALSVSLTGASGFFTFVALLLIVYGSLRFIKTIHSALADIFNFEITGETLVVRTVKYEAWSFIYLLLLLILVFLFTLFNIVASVSSRFIILSLPFSVSTALMAGINYTTSFIAIVIIFTIIYRFASYRRISWLAAAKGGSLGGLVFSLVSIMLGVYIQFSSVLPLYGAASFLVALVLWSYYVALALLLGAEAAKVSECRYPRHRQKVCL